MSFPTSSPTCGPRSTTPPTAASSPISPPPAAGRRVYLNRTLVDADFAIVLSGRDYDPLTGYAGAEGAIFPTLSDEETRESFAGQFSTVAPGEEPWPTREEASEILWLLGTPFLVQVIADRGDGVQEVVAGLPTASAEGIRRQDAAGKATMDQAPDTVIVALSAARPSGCRSSTSPRPPPARPASSRGVAASRCSPPPPRPGRGRAVASHDGRPHRREAAPGDRKSPTTGPRACSGHSPRRTTASILASGYPDEVAEELFTTPIRTASEVQRLIDGSEKVLLIPDANRMMVTRNDD